MYDKHFVFDFHVILIFFWYLQTILICLKDERCGCGRKITALFGTWYQLSYNKFRKQFENLPLHTLSKFYDVSAGSIPTPSLLILDSLLLYLRSPKNGCSSTSVDFPCFLDHLPNFKIHYVRLIRSWIFYDDIKFRGVWCYMNSSHWTWRFKKNGSNSKLRSKGLMFRQSTAECRLFHKNYILLTRRVNSQTVLWDGEVLMLDPLIAIRDLFNLCVSELACRWAEHNLAIAIVERYVYHW